MEEGKRAGPRVGTMGPALLAGNLLSLRTGLRARAGRPQARRRPANARPKMPRASSAAVVGSGTTVTVTPGPLVMPKKSRPCVDGVLCQLKASTLPIGAVGSAVNVTVEIRKLVFWLGSSATGAPPV